MYTIIRFYSDDRAPEIIKSGLSLYQAQEHCKREYTRKAGEWFDGYEETKRVKKSLKFNK